MPLTLDQLSGLITKAPAELYQGGAGAGMRQLGQQRSQERQHAAELQFNQQRHSDSMAAQRQEVESELFKQWGAALSMGDRDAIEASAQALERAGFEVQRPPGSETESRDTPENLQDFTGKGKPPENLQDFTGQLPERTRAEDVPANLQDFTGQPKASISGNPKIDDFFSKKAGRSVPARPKVDITASMPAIDAAASRVAPSQEQQSTFEDDLLSGKNTISDSSGAADKPKRADWIIKRSDGSIAASFDENSVRGERKARVAETFRPLIEGAQDETARQAGIAAARAAIQISDTDGVSKAVDKGMEIYKQQVGPRKARYVGGGGGGSGSPSLSAQRFDFMKEQNVANYIQTKILGNEQIQAGMRDLMKAEENAGKAYDLAKSPNSMAQLGALSSTLKTFFGSVTSDKELRTTLDAGGKFNQLEMEYKKWVAGGAMPEGFMAKIADMADQGMKKAHELRLQRAQHTRKRIDNDPLLKKVLTEEERQLWGDVGEGLWLKGGEMPEPKAKKPGDVTDADIGDLIQ